MSGKPDFLTDEQWERLCKARRSRTPNGGMCRRCHLDCEMRTLCPHSPEWSAQAAVEVELKKQAGEWHDLSMVRGER